MRKQVEPRRGRKVDQWSLEKNPYATSGFIKDPFE